LAPADGTVLDVINYHQINTYGFGWVVRINHNGTYSFFAHLDGDNNNIFVQAGQSVTQGQVIAKTGNTGNGSGFHLHFEARSGATVNNVNTGNAVPIRSLPGNWWNPWYSPTPNFQHDPNRYSGAAQYPESRFIPSGMDGLARHLSNNQSPPSVAAGWTSDISAGALTLHFGASPNTPTDSTWITTFQVYEMLQSCGGCWQPGPGGADTTSPTWYEGIGTFNQSESNGQHAWLIYDRNNHDGQGQIQRLWDIWPGNSGNTIPHIAAIYRNATDSTTLEYCFPNADRYTVSESHDGVNTSTTYSGPACSILVHRRTDGSLNWYSVKARVSGVWTQNTPYLIVHF
jgi:hypothetical protein